MCVREAEKQAAATRLHARQEVAKIDAETEVEAQRVIKSMG